MECYLEPSQLVTEEVLALLVTFEGAWEVQVHLSLHVLYVTNYHNHCHTFH